MSHHDAPEEETVRVPAPEPTSGTRTTTGPDTAAICKAAMEEDPRNDPEWDEEDPKKTLGLVLDYVTKERIARMRREREQDELLREVLKQNSGNTQKTTRMILLIVVLLVMIVGGTAGVYSVIKYNTQTGQIEASTSGPVQPAP